MWIQNYDVNIYSMGASFMLLCCQWSNTDPGWNPYQYAWCPFKTDAHFVPEFIKEVGLPVSCIYPGPHHFCEGSFLIATLAKPRLQSSELRLQQHFRWVTLRWDQEPLHGLLGRHLRRKLLHKVGEWTFMAGLILLFHDTQSHLDIWMQTSSEF